MADTDIHLWRWRYLDPISGKPRVTRHLMTEADAWAWDAAATPVADTYETRRVSDDPG